MIVPFRMTAAVVLMAATLAAWSTPPPGPSAPALRPAESMSAVMLAAATAVADPAPTGDSATGPPSAQPTPKLALSKAPPQAPGTPLVVPEPAAEPPDPPRPPPDSPRQRLDGQAQAKESPGQAPELPGPLQRPPAQLPGPGPRFTWPLFPNPQVTRPFQAPKSDFGPGHRGVDLAANPGQPVLAAGAGVVAFAGQVAGQGVVSVDHDGDLRTTYEPVTPLVAIGAQVYRGQPIATVNPGHPDCPAPACLHWGVRRGDEYLNPLALIQTQSVIRLKPWTADPP